MGIVCALRIRLVWLESMSHGLCQAQVSTLGHRLMVTDAVHGSASMQSRWREGHRGCRPGVDQHLGDKLHRGLARLR